MISDHVIFVYDDIVSVSKIFHFVILPFRLAKDTSANRFYGITGPVQCRAASKIIKATYKVMEARTTFILVINYGAAADYICPIKAVFTLFQKCF